MSGFAILSLQRRRSLLVVGALMLVAAGLAAGTWDRTWDRTGDRTGDHTGDRAPHREAAATGPRAGTPLPRVRVATVEAQAGDRPVRLPATTSAYVSANIIARASGYIETRKVDIGDHVKAGQLLATIVAPELDHQISQAEATLGQLQAALRQAEANQELARVTWHRDSPLVKEGWLPQQQGSVDVQTLKANDAAVGVAQANVDAQQAQLQVLKQQKLYQSVVAPFDGVVTQRNIDIGSLVQADAVNSTSLFMLDQSDVIRAQVYVPQDAALEVKPGIAAVIRVPEIAGRDFPGRVTRIADALQPGTRTLLVEIDIANRDGLLAPGTYCTAELHVPRRAPMLTVPAPALVFNEHGLQVAVVEDGVVHLRRITVARDLGTEVEIRDGLAAGDKVVLNPAVDLADGARVEIRVATNPPATAAP